MRKRKDRVKDLSEMLKSIKAGDIMTKDVITTSKNASLSEISEIMIKKRISGLPVCGSSGKLTGVITADDLFMVMDMIRSGDVPCSVAKKDQKTAPTVEFAMSTNVHKISSTMNLEDIIVTMKYKNAHTLPVVENDKLVGVVGRRDVFNNFYAVVKKLCL